MKRLPFFALISFFLLSGILFSLWLFKKRLNEFYCTIIKEETLRVKSSLESIVASGGDPVEALSSYIESSSLLRGATLKLEGREIIIPGSNISKDQVKKVLNIPPFIFTLYFDFSYLKNLNRHLFYVIFNILFLSFLFIVMVFLLVREYFKEKLLLEREKQEKRRLETINVVIHSILHEVKNRLNILRLLVFKLEKESKPSENLNLLKTELQSLGKYLEDTATLRRPLKLSKKKIDIASLIKEVVNKIRPLFEYREVKLDLSLEPCQLTLDTDKFSSVIYDLLKNALEAVEKAKEKEIKIIGKRQKSVYILKVLDSGGTLPSEDLFKPFFSTKKKGLGLGLFNAKRIVEAHNGEIKAFLQGKWTTFEIKLPLEP